MTSGDGTSSFTYDSTDQLATAVHSYQDTEGYTYDDNGNRTNSGYATGADNRVTSDGTYNYVYDAEGNCVRRTKISDNTTTRYVWDYRNRLVQVTEHPNATPSTPATRIIKYTYDGADRLVRRTLDTNADGTPETVAKYVYDGDDLALEMNGSNALPHRYLWNSAVDEILADEKIGDQVIWPLADHEGTVRDLVSSSGTVLNHRKYDSFGKITGESNPAVDHLFAYTGQILDEATGLQNQLHRWYNPALGRWISEDPASFSAGDANLYRYCGNSPTNYVDPSGLFWDDFWGGGFGDFGDFGDFSFQYDDWGSDFDLGYSDWGYSDWGMDTGWGDWSSDMALYSDMSWPLEVGWGGMDTGWGSQDLGSGGWGYGQGVLAQAMDTGWGGMDTSWGAEITRQMQAQTPTGMLGQIPLGMATAPGTSSGSGPQAQERGYWEKTLRHVVMGDFAEEDATLASVGISLAAGFTGVDVVMDIRDLWCSVRNWQWSWGHAGKTALNAVGVLPLVGMVKNLKHLDNIADVAKNADKVNDLRKAEHLADEVNDLRKAEHLVPEGTRVRPSDLGQRQGREFRTDQLETYEFDVNQPKHVRGWLENERRRIGGSGGGPDVPRTPPGYVQGHGRSTPAREGFDYSNSRLQGEDLNKLEERVRRRAGRP